MRRALAPRLFFTLLLVLCAGWPAAALAGRRTPWAAQKTPAPGPAQALGGYSAGCVVGAEALPMDTPELDVNTEIGDHRPGFSVTTGKRKQRRDVGAGQGHKRADRDRRGGASQGGN